MLTHCYSVLQRGRTCSRKQTVQEVMEYTINWDDQTKTIHNSMVYVYAQCSLRYIYIYFVQNWWRERGCQWWQLSNYSRSFCCHFQCCRTYFMGTVCRQSFLQGILSSFLLALGWCDMSKVINRARLVCCGTNYTWQGNCS